ncbi:uracil-DNA glycosylase [Youngiibacter fragilis]|uniref:Uracil-DNA glycosylase n=1 Tax=Youngiibacter fragilis 232.1 TaxID=994573 RepID=V7I0C2_9CLOT|nr:uracil-DNA glycosylase [Youngiibacter fragilis]ETA79670.1 uracil-DNA glycosylase [Youngiibacter fragilis 232.1]
MVRIGNSWDRVLEGEFDKEYYLKLREFLKEEYRTKVIYPDMHNIFNSLKLTSYEDVKVVILGQDPYHGKGQAHGLAFSVQKGVPKPPSLLNIFKELKDDLGYPIPGHGNLESWARQGVLLLNTVLTVREGQANSHQGKGWEIFTDTVIGHLSKRQDPIIFLLWGAPAGKKEALIDERHRVLKSVHPSPLSAHRGFFGSRPFGRANDILRDMGKEPIDWRIRD